MYSNFPTSLSPSPVQVWRVYRVTRVVKAMVIIIKSLVMMMTSGDSGNYDVMRVTIIYFNPVFATKRIITSNNNKLLLPVSLRGLSSSCNTWISALPYELTSVMLKIYFLAFPLDCILTSLFWCKPPGSPFWEFLLSSSLSSPYRIK